MKDRHPLKIFPSERPGKPFKATTSVHRVARASPEARAELALVAEDYSTVVSSARRALAAPRERRADPRVMWLVGDQLHGFLARLNDMGFYLVRRNDTLARELGISEVSVRKIISFRKRYPVVSMVNPAIPWSRYRDNKA
jgi:hypothetical protein